MGLALTGETVVGISDIVSSLTTGIQTAVNGGMDAISAVVPVAAIILGAFTAIGLGIKAFQRMGGKKG